MRKAYKFKLYRNKRKSNFLKSRLFIFCQIYNHSLALIKKHYKIFGKIPRKSSLQKHIKKLMDLNIKPQWKELGFSQGIQEVTDRIYKGYDAFFLSIRKKSKQKKSPPTFKPFRKYKSFTLKQAGWKLAEDNKNVYIGGKKYKYHNSQKVLGKIKTVTIKRDQVGDFYIIFSCELEDDYKPSKVIPMTGEIAGFDFGLSCFLTSSDTEKIKAPEYFKKSLIDLRQKSKKLSKKQKGSKNRKKAKKILSRLYKRISNQRLDFHFKTALYLIKIYDYLFFEDLNLSGMKALWGRKVSDLGLDQFIKILNFKAMEHNKTFYQIDRFFPSSKQCSKCLKIKKELPLKVRVFKCDCGLEIDRDLNASINIKSEGASSLGLDNVSQGLSPAIIA